MKTFILGAALFACAPAMQAGEAVNKELDAAPDSEISIDIVRGSIKVFGWDQNVVKVEGTRDEKSEEFIFKREGREIIIEDQLKRHSFGGGNAKGTNITVHVPRGSSVVTDVVSVDVELRDVSGAVRMDSVSGDMLLENLGQDTHASSVSGDIVLHNAGSEVHLESVSGEITADVDSERLSVESVSGDVMVMNRGIVKRGYASTVNGDVDLVTALAPNGEMDLESVNGDIRLVLRGEINARFNLETGPGGDIDNGLTDESPDRERYTGSEDLEMRIGQGGADVRASVVNGTITVKKE